MPAQAPQIAVNETAESLVEDYNGTYLLLMVDPDASYPENPQNRFIIHWWQEGLTKSSRRTNDTAIGGTLLENSTAARVDYRRPRPPPDSSAHRYIQYIFQQPAGFEVPDAYSGYNSSNSTRFPLEAFISDARLSSPVAANYFYCSNQSSVPSDFFAAPGQQYPNGNGAMVTQGTNEPSATTGTPSATSGGSEGGSASGSATASASAAAGIRLAVENVIFGLGLAVCTSLNIWW